MAYIDFPDGRGGKEERKRFWLSPDGIDLIGQWRREGFTIQEISAKYIGVSTNTFRRWMCENEALELACRKSQDLTNAWVEGALLKRALGYTEEEATEELVEGVMRVTKISHRKVAPDVKACLAWLYSRRPERWRANQDPLDATAKEISAAKEVLIAIGNAVNDLGADKVMEDANADSTNN